MVVERMPTKERRHVPLTLPISVLNEIDRISEEENCSKNYIVLSWLAEELGVQYKPKTIPIRRKPRNKRKATSGVKSVAVPPEILMPLDAECKNRQRARKWVIKDLMEQHLQKMKMKKLEKLSHS